MSIGSTIKRLRREKDITQEQLAEYLGITSRAVSQWECDRTAPDISQIPLLCHVFDVSSDLLLGINTEKNNEEINKYLEEAKELTNRGKFLESTALLRDANKKFPRDYKIMASLADAIVSEYSRMGIKEYDEVFELCNRILAECTDNITRYEAIGTLGVAYGYAGKQKEMLELASEMPKARFSYENFMVYRWKGNDDLKKRQDYLVFLLHEILSMIICTSSHFGDDGKFMIADDQRFAMLKLVTDLLEILFPDGDYQQFSQYGEIVTSTFVTIAIRDKDDEMFWHWLDRGVDFAIYCDTYDFEATHTSPILRGYSSGGWIMEASGNRSQSILHWLTTDNKLEAYRSDPRYEAMVSRLEKVAVKPQ